MKEDAGSYVKKVMQMGTFYRNIINSLKISVLLINGFLAVTFVNNIFMSNKSQLIINLLIMVAVDIMGYGVCEIVERYACGSVQSHVDTIMDIDVRDALVLSLSKLKYNIE